MKICVAVLALVTSLAVGLLALPAYPFLTGIGLGLSATGGMLVGRYLPSE
jgi:hypothetical protein